LALLFPDPRGSVQYLKQGDDKNMEKIMKLSELTADLLDQVQTLQELMDKLLNCGNRLSKITGRSGEVISQPLITGSSPADFYAKEPEVIDIYHEKAAGEAYAMPSKTNCPGPEAAGPSNVIPFPVPGLFTTRSARAEPHSFGRDRFTAMVPFLAMPGRTLPLDIPDYRPLLQRDGLILLAWDKRVTEIGERFTAYWVTSTGIPRFYASRPFTPDEFYSARPDHKSYAAEDGIEFYGQEAPVYMVHVAPELMMSNPKHGELRRAHIEMLKSQGSEVDFGYRYLLTVEKKRNLPCRKSRGNNQQEADA